jgi:LacI family transcriptional regulator, galactose operon repressor
MPMRSFESWRGAACSALRRLRRLWEPQATPLHCNDRIGMIMPPADANGESPRVTGFLKAHALRGKEVSPELLVPGGWHVQEGRDAAARLMELPAPPTAIVAPNDMAAIGAITKLKKLNRRVPEDVAFW